MQEINNNIANIDEKKENKKTITVEEMEKKLIEKRMKQKEKLKKIKEEEKKIINFKFKPLNDEVKNFIKRNKNDENYKEKINKVIELLKTL